MSTPAFDNGPSLTITPMKEIKKGGSSNSYTMSLQNHLGTHVDAPNHFDENGKPLSSFSMEDLTFTRPYLVDIPKKESELITRSDLTPHKGAIEVTDLLLLRTGFQALRTADPQKYSTQNPGLSADAAEFLATGFKDLRALGLDLISLSPVQNRDEGRRAHSALLKGRDFFIIEDMDLSKCPSKLSKVLVVPLFVEGVDSAPCTVITDI